MRKDLVRRKDAHSRVNGLCAEHPEIFAATDGGRKTVAKLDTSVSGIESLEAYQKGIREDLRAAFETCRRVRPALLAAMQAIVTVGRVVALDEPSMQAMEMPSSKITNADMLSTARALYDRVSPHADLFVGAGLPPDLLANLLTQVQTFATAKAAQATAKQRYTAATRSMLQKLDAGDATVDVLEAIAANAPGAELVLTSLRDARRVGPREAAPAAVMSPAPDVRAFLRLAQA